ncbi:MAG: (Fe-S)-binding protein [Cytophagaceae bacterium]|jgi:L-lactate dehydrogenase complex protein LldE|nr:(Fe-S)-binding protein [Cytophagaceae bacterium]
MEVKHEISLKEVELFVPCFIDQVYPETAINTVKLLRHLGVQVIYNPNQTCCGQPAFNAGFFDEAEEVACYFSEQFSGKKYIVGPSASCAGMVRNGYKHLFKNSTLSASIHHVSERILEISEFIVDHLKIDAIPGAAFPHKVTYHDACSACRECGIRDQPRTLLKHVKGLELIEMKESDTCCGFGGTFAVKFEPISVGMAQQKVDHALATGAAYIVSTDASCLMHMQAYIDKHQHPIQTMHLVDLLCQGWQE